MGLPSPSVPTVPNPTDTANTQQNFNTNTASQQQGINTATAGQQYGLNTATAGEQQGYNAATAAANQAFNAATAGQQQNYNQGNATANQAGSMVGQNNPWENLTYSQTGTGPNGVPLYTASLGLSPQVNNVVSSLYGQSGNLINNANYGSTDPGTTIGNMTTGATSDMLNSWASVMQPQFDYQNSLLDTQLRNQGFAPGTPGYDKAMNAQSLNQGQQRTSFMLQAEPTAYSQATSNYMLPLGISSAEMGLANPQNFMSSIVNTPGLNIANPTIGSTTQANTAVGGTGISPTTVNPVNYESDVSSANTANMAAYNAQVQQQGNMLSGLFGIPSAVLGGWAKGGFPGASSLGSLFGGAGGDAAAAAGMGTAADSAALLGSLGPLAMI